MGVSENSGIPKSSIFIGFSIINHPFWGTTIFGNTHIVLLYFKKGHWFRYRRREEPRVSSCSVLGWPSLAHLRRTRSLATCRASESECHSSCCHPRNPRSLRKMREVDEALMSCLRNLKVSQDVRHSSMRTQDFLKYVHKTIENLFCLFVYLRLLDITFFQTLQLRWSFTSLTERIELWELIVKNDSTFLMYPLVATDWLKWKDMKIMVPLEN